MLLAAECDFLSFSGLALQCRLSQGHLPLEMVDLKRHVQVLDRVYNSEIPLTPSHVSYSIVHWYP